jgi:hypothetical protein
MGWDGGAEVAWGVLEEKKEEQPARFNTKDHSLRFGKKLFVCPRWGLSWK